MYFGCHAEAGPKPVAKHLYKEAAAAAAALRVCVNAYVASEKGPVLAHIQPLSSFRGGVMLLYPSLADAAGMRLIILSCKSP